MPSRPKLSPVQLLLLAALFAFVAGARWAVVSRFGSDLPYWDQWDAEGANLLSPWLQHRLTLGMLVDHHNEHRVVLSRLVTLGLTLANGQWDQRVECAAIALIPAAVACGFLLLGFRHLAAKWRPGLVVLLMAAYGLPIAWENILRGFASAQHLLIALSFGAIVWLPSAAPWSRNFWLGAACAVAALGSMATGFLAGAVVIALLALRWWQKSARFRDILPALAVCLAVVAVGWLTRVTVPYHAIYRARDLDDFALSMRHSLQWPGYGPAWAWMAILSWLPWVWLTGKVLAARRPSGIGPLAPTLAGLGGWVILQLLATAYARGAGGPDPASRYEDTLVFGAVVNALAIAWLWQEGGLAGVRREVLAIAGIAWAMVFAIATAQNCIPIFHDELPGERKNNFYCEQNTRNYLATGDEAYLRHDEIPYPGVDLFVAHLRVPGLVSLLPVCVRPPLALAPAKEPGAFTGYDDRAPEAVSLRRGGALLRQPTGFSPGTPPLSNRPTWGSYGSAGAAGKGEWESRPLQAHCGWLKFEMAGQPGSAGVGLELRDARTGRILAEIRPDRTPGESWRSAYVRAPTETFILAARDSDPSRWLAFSEPVEMGPLSHLAWRAVRHGLLIAIAGGLAAIGLAAADGRNRRA